MIRMLLPVLLLMISGCGQPTAPASTPAKPDVAPAPVTKAAARPGLDAVLAAQPADVQARYQYRHPQQTLEFFGIEPGMRIVEALPGGGWYTRILLPYLGSDGHLAGADYAMGMWPKFGFFTPEQIEEKTTWVTDWTEDAQGWRDANSAEVSAFVLGSMPSSMNGTADAVLFIRALHNLNRFEDDGGYLTEALGNAYDALKPGGIVGIVQHEAPASATDEWADGSRGYLKRDLLIERMTEAGFEFVAASDINQNALDQPGEEDIVWRLPPTLFTSKDNPELRAKLEAIGESNRMTLKFRKPL